MSVRSLQGLLLLFLDKRDDFAKKNEDFYNPTIKNVLATINRMLYQLFAVGIQARDIYPELRKHFYKKHPNLAMEEFLAAKFGLRIDTRSSNDNTFHGSGRVVEKSSILFQI